MFTAPFNRSLSSLLQTCSEISENLLNGDFGEVGKTSSADAFRMVCSKKFPHSRIFREKEKEIENKVVASKNSENEQ